MKTAVLAIMMVCAAAAMGQKKPSVPIYTEPLVIDSYSGYTNTDGKVMVSACVIGRHLEWIATIKDKPEDTLWSARCYLDGKHGKQPKGVVPFPGTVSHVAPEEHPTLGDETSGYQVPQPFIELTCACFIAGMNHCTAGGACDPNDAFGLQGENNHVWGTQREVLMSNFTASMHSTGKFKIEKDFPHSVEVESKTGRIDRLSDAEYDELQSTPLRDVEAEKVKIATAHGVAMGQQGSCFPRVYPYFCVTDSWHIKGQWLTVNTPFDGGE